MDNDQIDARRWRAFREHVVKVELMVRRGRIDAERIEPSWPMPATLDAIADSIVSVVYTEGDKSNG